MSNETPDNQSFPDVNTMMSASATPVPVANDPEHDNDVSRVTDVISEVGSSVVEIKNSFSISFDSLESKIEQIISNTDNIVTNIGDIEDIKKQQKFEESFSVEQNMLSNKKDRAIDISRSLDNAEMMMNDLISLYSNINQNKKKSGFLETLMGLPMWVKGIFVALGIVTANELGVFGSDDKKTDSDDTTGDGVTTVTPNETSIQGSPSKLADLVAKGEAKKGGDPYKSTNRLVMVGKKKTYPSRFMDLPNMTIKQVLSEQAKGNIHAAGKYQMIRITLNEAVEKKKLTGNEKFDASMQEYLFAEWLVKGKRKAVESYINGTSDSLDDALEALAMEFRSISFYYDRLQPWTDISEKTGKRIKTADRATTSRKDAENALKYERELYKKRKEELEDKKSGTTIADGQTPAKVKTTVDKEQAPAKDGEVITKKTAEVKQTILASSQTTANIINAKAQQREMKADVNYNTQIISAVNPDMRTV